MYVILPLFSIVGILGVSWLIAAFLEIFTNNLTMIRILDSTIQTGQLDTHDTSRHGNFDIIDNKNDKVFWFVQISDLHLSQFRDYGQHRDFSKLCSTMLKEMKPSVIMLTGDLTDAKDVTFQGSAQYRSEWVIYEKMIEECKQNLPTTTKWMDVRGNHDSFHVPSLNREWNLYEDYGESKNSFSSGVTQFIHRTSYGNYAFTGIDLAPNPGPGRPFNFFALPPESTLKKIEEVSRTATNYKGNIWFGHYPLSITIDPHRLRKLLSTGIAYFCGHLHKFPFIRNMHALHNEGFMELELADWKLNRRYRIGAFDHDIFSFTDVEYPSPNAVIFTNPIDARYMVNGKIPLARIKSSTHIRFLLFGSKEIKGRIEVLIDDAKLCHHTQRSGPLYTCPWSPSKYSKGLHKLTVDVLNDEIGEKSEHTIQFSLDGTRPPLGLFSVILLLTDFCTMLRLVFFMTLLLLVVLPIIIKKASCKMIDVCRHFIRLYLPYVHHVIEYDVIFWKLVGFNIVVALGPQSVGYFVTNSVGVLFAYGIWSGHHFLPGTLTYLLTSRELLLFNMVTFLSVGQLLSERNTVYVQWKNRKTVIFLSSLMVWYFYGSARMFCIAYGWLSAVTNTLSTWCIFFYFYLLYKAVNI